MLKKTLPLIILFIGHLGLFSPSYAQEECTVVFTSQPLPEQTYQVELALYDAGIPKAEVTVSAFGETCVTNEESNAAQSFTPSSTDFDLRLSVASLTDLPTLGALTRQVITTLDRFPPDQTPGSEAGNVTITFLVGDFGAPLQFAVTDGSQKAQTEADDDALLLGLGYDLAQIDTLLRHSAPLIQSTLCEDSFTSQLIVENVGNLSALEIELIYDPAYLQATAITPQGVFADDSAAFVNTRNIDTPGLVQFAVALTGDPLYGDSPIATITWLARQPGQTDLSYQTSSFGTPDGLAIAHTPLNSTVQVSQICDPVTGRVTLQGRDDQRGTVIQDATGQTAETDLKGYFDLYGGISLIASHPGYLSANVEIDPFIATTAIELGAVELLAGDINGDQQINIFDLSYIASAFNGDDAQADLNGDGIVNIFDLSLTASNYEKSGPLSWEVISAPSPEPTPEPSSSLKYGVGASIGVSSCEDAESLNTAWYYNWELWPRQECPFQDRFVPRAWGEGNVDILANNLEYAKSSGWLIGFNEPNLPHQSNISPEAGAELWRRVEEIARPHGIKLVSPAPNQDVPGKWPGDDYGYGWTWAMMDAYEAKYGEPPHFDALGWHIYSSDPNFIKTYLTERRTEAEARGLGDLKFWILEYSGCFVNNQPELVMNEITAWFEAQDWIERYAWFFTRLPAEEPASETPCALINDDGTLSELGRQYRTFRD